MRLLLLIPIAMLPGFSSPKKTMPVYYLDDNGTSLRILQNCKDNGFLFTLKHHSDECTETLEGTVPPSKKEFRFETGTTRLVFSRHANRVVVTEESSDADRCRAFGGTYKRITD